MSRLVLRAGVAAASAALAALLVWQLRPETEVATVGLVDARDEIEALLLEAGDHPAPAGAGLARVPLRERTARIFFPAIGTNQVYDEHLLARRRPGFEARMESSEHPRGGWTIRTNSLGLREDAEVPAEKADVRILVVGDSHVDGLCDNADSFPNLLEAALSERHPDRSVEVLNAGTGGWSFYNYLGALEGLADLRPDAFVVVVYGGNDFQGALSLHHLHRGERAPRAPHRTLDAVLEAGGPERAAGVAAQFLVQAAYLHDHPEEEQAAGAMAAEVTAEIQRQCAERGVRLLCVYLPPWPRAQPGLAWPLVEEVLARVPLPEEALAADERLADGWLSWLEGAGIAAVDLRPALRAEPEAVPLYWSSDHHLNLDGHRAAARALLAPLEALCGLAR